MEKDVLTPLRWKYWGRHCQFRGQWRKQTRSIWKMLGPFATASRFTLSFTKCRYCRHCRMPPAHRCPRRLRQRQRV